MSDEDFLRRWSRRKHQVRKGEDVAPAPPVKAPDPVSAPPAASPADEPAAEAPLPPVESLTPESDFTPFMRSRVDAGTRNAAMKALFKDPRFNVMDGLDVYIDDYSKPDPLPDGWLEKMNQVARLGAYEPPQEREGEAEESNGSPVSAAAPSTPHDSPELPSPDGEPGEGIDSPPAQMPLRDAADSPDI